MYALKFTASALKMTKKTSHLDFFCVCFILTEPGYYKTNDFGIRIEDIAVTIPAQTKVKKKKKYYLLLI